MIWLQEKQGQTIILKKYYNQYLVYLNGSEYVWLVLIINCSQKEKKTYYQLKKWKMGKKKEAS